MSSLDQQQVTLTGPDPVAAMSSALQLARPHESVPINMDVRLFDNYYRTEYQCGDYIEVTCTFPRLKLPDGTLTLKGQDPLAELAITCQTTVVPVVIDFEGGAGRWSGRIDVAHDKINPDGAETVECELVGDLTMLDRIVAWPQPFLPIEVQPSEAVLIGPAITVFKTLVAENCMRLQLGLWELFNTLGSLDLDWRTWFGTILMQNSISLSEFMQMVTTGVRDTHRPADRHIAMDRGQRSHGHAVAADATTARRQRYLSQHGFVDARRAATRRTAVDLQAPTLCFNLRNYLGVTGPTGTVVDGAVQDLVDLEGSLLGGVLNPFLNPDNEYVPPGSDIVIAPTLGVNFVPPWVVFNADADDSGIVSMDVAHHHPVCWQVILGGKSPKWLNDFINASLEYLVDILMMTIGITGISNSIFDGLLDNAFLAFEFFEWFDRRALRVS
ncbi:Gp37-like protein [Mycobacterium botniense]|uniref:Gp28/Gp37-like domain-containing protein n=1 Tax=Mycobacterium botniense TaxID=84962 RepID=A0A7I9XRQ2_9MYCO|nr:hypothetical protein [Mycobacterium botniense]GFG72682.1 hypothetical protein MBOT_00470 [Mycobacterium botniense]